MLTMPLGWFRINATHFPFQHYFPAAIDNFNKIDTYNAFLTKKNVKHLGANQSFIQQTAHNRCHSYSHFVQFFCWNCLLSHLFSNSIIFNQKHIFSLFLLRFYNFFPLANGFESKCNNQSELENNRNLLPQHNYKQHHHHHNLNSILMNLNVRMHTHKNRICNPFRLKWGYFFLCLAERKLEITAALWCRENFSKMHSN